MKKIFYILLTLGCLKAGAQVTLSPQVLNAAGSTRTLGNGGATVTDNVGEPFTETVANANNKLMLTQGFVQPDAASTNVFSVTAFPTDVSCNGKHDGRISTAIITTAYTYDVSYVWTPSVACPAGGCSGSIDSLAGGVYSLSVIFTYTNLANTIKTDTVKVTQIVVHDDGAPCKVKVFNGITANADGLNDVFYIENIEEYPNNRVTVYNRWGAQLYDEKGYNNTSKAWPSSDELGKLVPSTYFYVINLGDGSKLLKGWIELIKN